MSIVLPALKASEPSCKCHAKYSAPVRRPIEPVGRYFLAHALRTLRGHTWLEFEKLEAQKNVKLIEVNEDEDLGNEEQGEELLAHDPREWKSADLYAVLGILHLRWRATQDQLRRAHRKLVLKHHPDKKSASGGLEQDGFFKIIQKAFEVMMDPAKRQQYDSVDENANALLPAPKSEYDFFEAWTPFFESEGRFSKKQPVPSLGGPDAPKAEVDAFYSFWGKFDSWKTFEFKDEDVPDDTANRDHKRYIERKNIATRKKLKQEDNKRVIDFVERAYAEDPRVKAFKEAARLEKERKKWDRDAGPRKAAEEAARKKAEAEAAAKAAEQEAQLAKASSKKAKEAAKAAKKKQKRTVRGTAKEQSYFGDVPRAADIDADIELVVDKFGDAELAALLEKLKSADAAAAKAAYSDAIAALVLQKAVDSQFLKYFN